jgi:hypothetical protein
MVSPLLLIVSAAYAQAVAQFAEPAWARFAVPQAADHIAVMGVIRGWGPSGEDRATITQSGPWLREDVIERGASSTSISNLESAMSYHFTRQSDGQFGSLSISGKHGATLRTVEKTDETDQLLGETCTIWLFKADTITERNCLTADRIMLWQSIVGRSGTEISSAHALSITRRKIRLEEVEVPSDLLQLGSWNGWSLEPAQGLNDEVLLQSAITGMTPGKTESLIIRRLGLSVMTDRTSDRGRTRVFSRPGIHLTLNEKPDGSLDRLEVTRVPPTAASAGPFGKPVQLVPPKTLTILGEPCSVFDMAPGVSDFGRTQCQTTDGLVLAEDTVGRASRSLLTAVRITRGKLGATDVTPPADILSGRGQ